MYILYNIILFLASAFLIPYYGIKILATGKYKKSIGQKIGVIPLEIARKIKEAKNTPRIWVHAVSVGEVTAAAPIISFIRKAYPDSLIVLSTSTETGQEMARKIIEAATTFIYYPLDIPFVIKKVIDLVRPDIFITVETEIWPNFMHICKKRDVRIAMVNGRVSPRSFARYKATRFFWRRLLCLIDAIGAISENDARRLEVMGAKRVRVLGNAKYDSFASKADKSLLGDMRNRLNIPEGSKVLVAGSTHEGEEDVVLKVYRGLKRKYEDMILVMVPRHVERARDVLAMVEKEGNRCISMSEINGGKKRLNENVVIVDVIGELFCAYGLATFVFCGGSLVPKGGQNILEPAAWGKVVFYGPFMDDFPDEKEALESSGAGITVTNGEELLEGMLNLMKDPDELYRRGREGREIVAANAGASKRYADMIKEVLKRQNG
jgi:3-deoxy-D-manno-octulosonic-acid transferase